MEVMVVLLIIGLMAGAVTLSFPPQREPVLVQGEKLATRLQLASQSSVVEHTPFGVKLEETGYVIVKFKDNAWSEIAQYTYDMDDTPAITLMENGAIIDLEAANKANIPVIRYDTTGLATPFTLSMATSRARIRIVGAVDGRVELIYGGGP